MGDLFWPGDHRAAQRDDEQRFLDAMVDVERVWLTVLASAGLTEDTSTFEPSVADLDVRAVESGGNPVIALVDLLRDRSGNRWIHRGLTSQDVVDTALMIFLRDVVAGVQEALRGQIATVARLAVTHRETAMVARTLGQWAVPTTFGLKAAGWLAGLLDVVEDLDALVFRVQLGGAAGTLAAPVELGLDISAVRRRLADSLGLTDALPWHTSRRPVTRIGDALAAATDAWTRIANDVVTLSRPEVGELSEATAGGSSTMPGKANPVLATLLRRAGLTAAPLAATLHLAAADECDERALGGWHAEWDTLRLLAHRVVVAAGQATDLLDALRVHPEAMAATLDDARDRAHAEQRSMAEAADHEPVGDYRGEADAIIDAVVARARETIR